ncbi:MAG: carboxypeptidase-like regulatory domain-containing protein [Bacteroidia bacterium]
MINKFLLVLSFISIVNISVIASGDNSKTVATKLVIKDAVTQELLPGVAIKIDNSKETLYTDLNGEVTINSIKGLKYDLSVHYIGYTSENIRIEGGNEKITIKLKP